MRRISAIAMVTLSGAAALLVVTGAVASILAGPPGPTHDEGTGAHVFQILIAALIPTGLLFLANAEWHTPARAARPLAASAILLVVAFGVLFYFEKVLGY
jgi:hypothetical protein